MSRIAVRTEDLGKQYTIGRLREPYRTLRDTLAETASSIFRRKKRSKYDTFWALDGVSFEIAVGEAMAVIGPNGAGKSTLLKILSRIAEPTRGFAEIYGRVGSLLEVGTGFHQELTGRENIYLNGAILGMRKEEIDRKLDQIVAFSEVERFIDMPVKRYSSGMYLRLAFSVAAHLEPEVLIVDEVLAVGDASFQQKCLGKMKEVANQERTVMFVSHNMAAVTQLCQTAIWIDHGCIQQIGPAAEVVGAYLSSGAVSGSTWTRPEGEVAESEAPLRWLRLLGAGDEPAAVVPFSQPCRVEIGYDLPNPVRNLSIMCRVTNAQGTVIWTSWDTDNNEWNGQVREAGQYRSVCLLPAGLLRPGRYSLTVGSFIQNVRLLERHDHVLSFDVSDVGFRLNHSRLGVITPVLDWLVERVDHVATAPVRIA